MKATIRECVDCKYRTVVVNDNEKKKYHRKCGGLLKAIVNTGDI